MTNLKKLDSFFKLRYPLRSSFKGLALDFAIEIRFSVPLKTNQSDLVN